MRKLMAVGVLAVLAGLGLPGKASAQYVVGTGGALMPGGGVPMMGYYSPYPGTIYSPYRSAPLGTTAFYSPAFAGGPAFTNGTWATPNTFGYGYGAYSGYGYGGYGYNMNGFGTRPYPHYGTSPFAGRAYHRW